MAKRSQRLSVAYDTDDMLVTFKVLDAADKVLATQSFDFDAVHDSLQEKVSLYGLNKLLTDRTSAEKNKTAKLSAMSDVMDSLSEGEWAKERVVGAIVVSPEVEALAELEGLSIPQVQKALAEYDKDTRKNILGSESVQAKARELREARTEQVIPSLDKYKV